MTEASRPTLVLKPEQVMSVIDHARAERPNEACGLMGGRDGRVEKVYPLANVEQSSVRYLAEPQAQFDAMLEMEDRSTELVAIYHSHVEAPAYPSPIDVEMAAFPDAVYLIVSLADKRNPVLGAFRIRDKQVDDVDIVVERPESIQGRGRKG
jgi:proteasome lid subunit RPN8/RPN11